MRDSNTYLRNSPTDFIRAFDFLVQQFRPSKYRADWVIDMTQAQTDPEALIEDLKEERDKRNNFNPGVWAGSPEGEMMRGHASQMSVMCTRVIDWLEASIRVSDWAQAQITFDTHPSSEVLREKGFRAEL